MRIDRIEIQGITTYREPAALDLAALGPGIIAIAGPNGGGKTSLLEAVPGAVYRQTPSRGSIASVATARDAKIEIMGENGQPFRICLNIDSANGKQEAVIFDAAGEPLAGPKVRDFDAYVATHFPSLDVYLASFFASQTGVGSVLKMSRGDRRALFGRLLGLERLELMAGLARERARASESEMTAARAALEAIRSGAQDIAALEAGLLMTKESAGMATAAAKEADERVRTARSDYEAASAAVKAAELARKAAADASRKAGAAKDRWRRTMDSEKGLLLKLESLTKILDQAPAIRGAAEKVKAVMDEADRVRADGEILSAEYDRLRADARKRNDELYLAERAVTDASRSQDDALAKAEEAQRRLTSAEKATAGVPCAGILEDEKRGSCPALVGHFRTRDESRKIMDAVRDHEAVLEKAFADAKERELRAGESVRSINAQIDRVGKELSGGRAKYQDLRRQADELKRQDRSAELDKAEAEVGILRPAHEAATLATYDAADEYEAAQLEAEKLVEAAQGNDEVIEKLAAADEALVWANAKLEKAHKELQEAHGAVVRFETQLAAAREAQAKARAIQERLAPMERDLADWRWLSRGLGREGVQALELDAAGPRVSGLANELLADAYGPRFQIRFETQAAKADGKGVKETFDVVVVDTERGREGNGEDLSGGEKVIVGEALGLAVGIFHAQAAGVSLGTVIRDETVGALDPENGERYLAMLRAFLRVGHVHQLLYVAHNPALVDLADAVVRVEEGRIHA